MIKRLIFKFPLFFTHIVHDRKKFIKAHKFRSMDPNEFIDAYRMIYQLILRLFDHYQIEQ